MKKIIIIAVIAVVCLSSIASVSANESNIIVKVNGKVVRFTDVKPFMRNNYLYVPVRFVVNAMDYSIRWEGNTNTAIVSKDKQEFRCMLGHDTAIVKENGEYKTLPIILKENRVCVPIDFITDTLQGSNVEFENDRGA